MYNVIVIVGTVHGVSTQTLSFDDFDSAEYAIAGIQEDAKHVKADVDCLRTYSLHEEDYEDDDLDDDEFDDEDDDEDDHEVSAHKDFDYHDSARFAPYSHYERDQE